MASVATGVKTREPGAKRYFFVPSTDGQSWELAEATFRRRAWEVAYPGAVHPDRFESLPPPKADWVELVPPGRGPKAPWPPKVKLRRPDEADGGEGPAAPPAKHVVKVAAPPPHAPKAKTPATAPAVPKKAIPGLSRDLAALLREQQLAQKAPEGMAKCPLCGAIVEPTRTKKVRTHDDPLTGARCEASNRPFLDIAGRPRPSRRSRASEA